MSETTSLPRARAPPLSQVRELPGALDAWRAQAARAAGARPTRPGRVLVLANFALLHELIPRDAPTLSRDVASFAAAWRAELARAPPPAAAFWRAATVVYAPPPALHKFRQPFCTAERARALGETYSRTLSRELGWRVLDAHAMTAARPESADDGMHYDESLTALWNAALIELAVADAASA